MTEPLDHHGPVGEVARDDRIVLREIVPADAEALLELLGDAEVMTYSTTGTATREECVAFIHANRGELERTAMGAWAICRTDDPTLLGYCRLRRDAEWLEAGEVEIGYRLVRRVWGQGLATAAARLAADLAFDRYGATTLIAVIDPGNTSSVAVAERLGMTPVRELMLPEYDHPDIVYALSR